MKYFTYLLKIVFFTYGCFSYAASDDDFFDSNPIQNPKDVSASEYDSESPLSFSGAIGYRMHYALNDKPSDLNFDQKESGLALSRADLLLNVDFPIKSNSVFFHGSIRGDTSRFSNEPPTIHLDETYIDMGSPQGFKYKVGRQFAVFGESNYFQVLDMVNPADQRELGLAELDESRLPLFSSRLSYIDLRWGMDLVLLHEFRANRSAVSQGDFDTFISLGGKDQVVFQSDPDVNIANSDVVFRAFKSQSWGDINIIMADKHEYSPTIVGIQAQKFVADYPKVKTYGVSTNYVFNHWVFKADYAHRVNVLFLRDDVDPQVNSTNSITIEKPLDELMIGFRYGGIPTIAINVEMLNQRIRNYEKSVSTAELTTVSAVGIDWNIWQERLRTSLLWSQWWQGDDSRLIRLTTEYDVNDFITLSGGYIDYSGDKVDRFYSIRNNDRLFLGVNYGF